MWFKHLKDSIIFIIFKLFCVKIGVINGNTCIYIYIVYINIIINMIFITFLCAIGLYLIYVNFVKVFVQSSKHFHCVTSVQMYFKLMILQMDNILIGSFISVHRISGKSYISI